MSTDDIKLLDRELNSKGYTERERKFCLTLMVTHGSSVANLLYNLAKVESVLDTSPSSK